MSLEPGPGHHGLAWRFLGPLAVATGVLALDQVTKLLVRTHLAVGESIPVVEGVLNVVYARNPGAAFSFLADAPAWFRGPFFIGITVIALIVVLYAIARLPTEDWLMRMALGGVLGGALGNLFDRLLFGQVTDFIDVYWRSHHWPAFNVADSSITLAVVAVVLQSLLCGNPEARAHRSSNGPSS
jgi:signal peptidase II